MKSLEAEFSAVEEKKKARFARIMELWCDDSRLTPEMFNANEGRSNGNILLQAFKAFKVRLYGFARQVAGLKTFIIVDIDPAKKQDRADPRILKRAKRRADDLGKGK